jgi:hypothetical protein
LAFGLAKGARTRERDDGMKLRILAFAAMACLAAPAARAQLARQNVVGVWRECIYQMPPRLGSSNPRRPIGSPTEEVIRVGRGEPCPAAYPGRSRSRRPAPPVSTWSSEPTP